MSAIARSWPLELIWISFGCPVFLLSQLTTQKENLGYNVALNWDTCGPQHSRVYVLWIENPSASQYHSEADCLAAHEPLIEEWMGSIHAATETPISSLNVEKSLELITEAKDALKTVDVVLKDAKRRTQASRPKKRKASAPEDADVSSSVSED